MGTTPFQIAEAVRVICGDSVYAPPLANIYTQPIWPEAKILSEFKKRFGDVELSDDGPGKTRLHALFIHGLAEFSNENTSRYATDTGSEIYTVELHYIKALYDQFHPTESSYILFTKYIYDMQKAFLSEQNKHFRLSNHQVSHTPLRSLGRIPPFSEFGPFKTVHYAVMTFDVINGDCHEEES